MKTKYVTTNKEPNAYLAKEFLELITRIWFFWYIQMNESGALHEFLSFSFWCVNKMETTLKQNLTILELLK